jgi:DNA repair exonuclease SbcCD ATPase subunit
LGELIHKLESLTSEKIAKEKELIEMDLELTRLRKRLEKEEKDRKKEKTRLTTRNEELESAFEENQVLKSQLSALQEELAVTKKSEQSLRIQVAPLPLPFLHVTPRISISSCIFHFQVSHLKESQMREVADVQKKDKHEIELLKQDLLQLESELRAERERARRGEHVEAAQKKIASLEKELDSYRQVAQKKFDVEMSERLQLEDRITELSALIGNYEERALQDAEKIRDLEEHQVGGVDRRALEQGTLFLLFFFFFLSSFLLLFACLLQIIWLGSLMLIFLYLSLNVELSTILQENEVYSLIPFFFFFFSFLY